MKRWLLLCMLLMTVLSSGQPKGDSSPLETSYQQWSLEDAVWILNGSPWAQREIFTRVIEGVGSGVRGEKEILSSYFVRFLSAAPIRQAYVRIQQLRHGYDLMNAEDKEQFDLKTAATLGMGADKWIVVAVAFRSNDPDLELRFERFFSNKTLDTLRTTTSLSTRNFPRLDPVAYFPPAEDSVGLRFVFPRRLDGKDVISDKEEVITFEMSAPVGTSRLRSTFKMEAMKLDGQLIF